MFSLTVTQSTSQSTISKSLASITHHLHQNIDNFAVPAATTTTLTTPSSPHLIIHLPVSIHHRCPTPYRPPLAPISIHTHTQMSNRPKTLHFITGNANKLSEVRAILADVEGLQLESRDVEGLLEVQGTVEDVAREKCRGAAVAVSS